MLLFSTVSSPKADTQLFLDVYLLYATSTNDHVGGHHVLLSVRDLLRKEAKEKAKQEAKDARVPCGDPPLFFSVALLGGSSLDGRKWLVTFIYKPWISAIWIHLEWLFTLGTHDHHDDKPLTSVLG